MIERDSVQIEKDPVRRRARNKKLGPKPWRWQVARLKRAKFRRRFHWSRKRWARYHDERAQKRDAPKRPYLKATRLLRQAEAHAAERRRVRRQEAAQRRALNTDRACSA